MANALNALIAQPFVADPGGAYHEQKQANALNALKTRGAEMDLRKGEMEMDAYSAKSQEDAQRKKMLPVVIAMARVQSLPEDQRQAAWQQAVPELQKLGHDPGPAGMQWNQAAADQAIGQYDIDAFLKHAMPDQIKPTANIQDYEYAVKNGFTGSPLEYQQQVSEAKRRPSTSLTFEQRKELVDHQAAARARGRPAGGGGSESWNNPVQVIGPDGKPRFVRFGNRGGVQEVNDYQPPASGPSGRYSARELQQARDKMRVLGVARRQLANLKAQRDKIRDSYASGPGMGMLTPLSESGSNFDAAVDEMRDTITGLTRTPGVGAMTDFETRLSQAKLPTRNEFESSRDQKIQGLENFINELDAGYRDLLEEGPAPQQQPAPGAGGGWHIEPVP